MKESFYFSHDYNARDDQKILVLRGEFGVKGYGLFWMCLESMAEDTNGNIHREAIGGLSVSYGCRKDELEMFINFCINIKLFFEKDNKIFSKRLVQHKKMRNSLKKWGKIGAESRWAGYSHPNSDPNAKERKGKERKGKEREELWNFESFKKYAIEKGFNDIGFNIEWNKMNNWVEINKMPKNIKNFWLNWIKKSPKDPDQIRHNKEHKPLVDKNFYNKFDANK